MAATITEGRKGKFRKIHTFENLNTILIKE